LSRRAIELFNKILFEGVIIDVATVVSVLPTCAELGYISIGRAIHAFCIKSGLILELQLCYSLMDMYSKYLNVDSTVQIFKRMKQRRVVSWIAMIMANTQQGHYYQAIDLFLDNRNATYLMSLLLPGLLHVKARAKMVDEFMTLQ
jgi:pentatricopeptide repeat protein